MEEISLPKGYRYDSGYVGLPYALPEIAQEIEIDGEILVAKPEFHMSILSIKKYGPMLAEKEGITAKAAEERVLFEASKLLAANSITIKYFKNELRLAEEREKKTIIIMCEANGADELFVGIRRALNLEITTQPFHVTLYTRDVGIGLTSEQEVDDQTRLLTTEESERVKKAINFDLLPQATKNS